MESLGNKLKSIRESKGWSYDYISRETNISTRYLEALEKEDFSCFPGEPYVRGFLKNYGEYLGVNGEELLSLYRSLRLQEQPVPVEQLLKPPSPLPKIIGAVAIAIAVLALAGGAIFIISKLPQKNSAAVVEQRTALEYTMNENPFERRFYLGDSIITTVEDNTYKLVFSGLKDAVTITTPKGNLMLDLGQDVTVDLNDDGIQELKITALEFAKNNSSQGVQLRFEQESMIMVPNAGSVDQAAHEAQISTGRETLTLIPSVASPFPFTLRAVFQGYCLFRYEILNERERRERKEQYYQRSEEINVTAQNGIRLGISNAQAARLQAIGGDRTVPFETGGAGEVVAADIRWVRDDDRRYRLVLVKLD